MVLGVAALSAAGRSSDAAGAPDPAARGLDLFLHVPGQAPPRGILPVQVEAIGFPTAVTTQPLANVTIEAVWNPEHLGTHVSVAPPAVRVNADATGRAHLDVPVPDGDEMELELLVGVRSGAHTRTQAVKVKRVRPYDVALFVPDRRVVPGSTISAWVLVTSALSGTPVPRAPLTLRLGEGGVPRFEVELTTDVSGTAMARVPIPMTEEPAWTWHLSAAARLGAFAAGDSGIDLTPREESPGKPQLHATWNEDSVLAGDPAHFVLRVRDANDQPVAGQAVRYWVGPRGTEPPDDATAWEKASTRALTSSAGEITAEAATPSTLVIGVGSQLRVVARASVDGRDLTSQAWVTVGAPAAEATLAPEGDRVVPGLEQRVFLSVHDGKGRPVSAPFRVDGDGLVAHVRTDDHGEAEISWRAPLDLGAERQTGPCAGGVAAAVTVRAEAQVAALATHPDPFELCVKVDRDATSLVRTDRTLVRAGDKVHVRVVTSDGKGPRTRRAKGPWSVVASNHAGTSSASAWIEDGEAGGDVAIPTGASGVWSLSATSPGGQAQARVTAGAALVIPPVLPKLAAKVTGGRATPGGAVDVEAVLTDAAGHGLAGSVSAVVIDRFGGGSIGGLSSLDTRRKLCTDAGADDERCDPFVEGDPSLEPLRRSLLGGRGDALSPVNDPEGRMQAELRDAFRAVVKSLEGAVFEAAHTPEQLRDVRRRGSDGAWQWNPELMTLVTAAMEPKPITPGGEPLSLGDLFAIDGQVTFSNVARRITRLKLFRVLAEMRRFKIEKALDADEPALRDPNALLRRLVRDERLEEAALVDPWGGSLRFMQTTAAPVPFMTVARGWELRAPGPDGVAGTVDDVRDPFERVLKSGTPYAIAVQEDRIVDAKWDMEVGETTVSAWQTMFEELTGSALGSGGGVGAGGIGLGGVGSGGGGIGHGRAGSVRVTTGNPSGVAFWSPPMRTDANGRVVIHVPLGDIETTWRIALVGVPDGATPATASVDVASELPLAAHIDAGTRWVEGDSVDAVIAVRNRAAVPKRATLTVTAGGVLELVGSAREMSLDVPAGGIATTRVRARARRAGTAELSVVTRAPGLPDDVARHAWEVRHAGEAVDVAHVQWIEGENELGPWLDPKPYVALGPARLILERGLDVSLSSALDALDPDHLRSAPELADALEVASRLRAWGITRGGEQDPLVVRATTIQRRATGRLAAYAHLAGAHVRGSVAERASLFAAPGEAGALGPPAECPVDAPDGDLLAAVDGLDAEPAPMAGGVASCWDAYVTTTLDDVDRSGDPTAVARALLALADRPHRAARAHDTAERLAALVGLTKREPLAAITLPPSAARDRAARATVYAGLVRAIAMDRARAAELPRLIAWTAVQRDPQGGYGSSSATRAVVRALLAASPPPSSEKLVAHVVVDGKAMDLVVPPGAGVAAITLPAGAEELTVTAKGVLARLERPGLRPWTLPEPGEPHGALHADITWPATARAGRTGLLRVALRHDGGHAALVDVKIPLPPGVTLAEPIPTVRQVQGVLTLRRQVDGTRLPNILEIPIRFLLEGKVTVPEAQARYALQDAPRVVVPARPFSVASP